MSLVPQWNRFWKNRGGLMDTHDPLVNDAAFEVAARWLDHPDIDLVEDWGCGHAQFRRCIAPRQAYWGVDGASNARADYFSELSSYSSDVPGIHMRGVIEHIPEWKPVLTSLVRSARVRAAVTLFTPMVDVHQTTWPTFAGGGQMCVQRFTLEEIHEVIAPCRARVVTVPGKNNDETVILIDTAKSDA